MDAIRFECGECGRPIKVGSQFAGRRGKCPGCGVVLVVPLASQPDLIKIPPVEEVGYPPIVSSPLSDGAAEESSEVPTPIPQEVRAPFIPPSSNSQWSNSSHEEPAGAASDADEEPSTEDPYPIGSESAADAEEEAQDEQTSPESAADPSEAREVVRKPAKRGMVWPERIRAPHLSRKLLLIGGSALIALVLVIIGAILFHNGQLSFHRRTPYANVNAEFDRMWNERLPQLMKDQKVSNWANIPPEYRDRFAAEVARQVDPEAKRNAPPPITLDASAADVIANAETASVTLQPSWGSPQATPSPYSWNLLTTVRITAKKPLLRMYQDFMVTAYNADGKAIDETSAGQATDLSPGDAGTLEFRVSGFTAGNVQSFKIFHRTN